MIDPKAPQAIVAENIKILSEFHKNIQRWFDGNYDVTEALELRSRINRTVRRVNEIVWEAGCLKLLTVVPPPAVGGLFIRNTNPFDSVLESYYGVSPIPLILDMIDETIGVLESPEYLEKYLERLEESSEQIKQQKVTVKAQQRMQKILVLSALPGRLRLDQEIREIESAIKRGIKRDLFEIKIRTAVRSQDIRRALAEERPQIVHFCGHGLEDGSLVLEDV